MKTLWVLPALALLFVFAACDDDTTTPPPPSRHKVTTLEPSKDNSMYEEGDYSNGKGQYLFTGENFGGDVPPPDARRALIAFDIAGNLPANATIDSVQLTIHVSKVPAAADTFLVSLHRVDADWGEGDSNANGEEGTGAAALEGDATWAHAFFDTVTWAAPGGDYTPAVSAQTGIRNPGFYVWKSTEMAADVQRWLDTPADNFGWIVIGDEAVPRSAKRFDSRENPTAENRPRLKIHYTEP